MARLPYAQLIEVKRWADHALYDAVNQNLDQLTEQEIEIMLRVLDHIQAVDRIFQCHLEGRPHGYRAARSDTLSTLEALEDGMKEVDDWYAAHVSGLPSEAFDEVVDFVFTSGKPARMTRAQILLHISLHGSYHRGNAGAILQLKGLTPGRDGLTDFLEATA